jgi:hypothetical protein
MHRELQCISAMNLPRVAAVALAMLFTAACGGFTTLSPSAPSAISSLSSVTSVSPTPAPAPTHAVGPDVPAGLVPTQQVITGSVGPLTNDVPPCYLERYSCEKYRFTMHRDGAVEVTLTWQGGERAMLIQLYRAGAGLVHEDLAPRGGAPQITFRRTDIPAMDYELRVVNMEPSATHPFTLTLTRWE